MDASVIIPTYQGGARFAEVLSALQRQQTGLTWELLVIDSGSRDGTRELAVEAGAKVLDQDPRTFNHGATRDRAIAASGGEFAVLLVQDAVPDHPGWLEALVAPLQQDPEAAGAFSRQRPIPGGNPILDQRLLGWIAGKDEPRRRQLASRSWAELDPFERLDLVAFDNVSSCIRRSVWKELPFGPRPFGEDLAWATRAIRAGHALRFHPDSVVEHSHDRSAWYETRRIYCDHRNLHQLLGLHTVKTFRQVRDGRRGALRHYESILAAATLTPGERARRRRWARRYSWGEVLAQWLAPKVNQAGEKGMLGWLDRRIRRGI